MAEEGARREELVQCPECGARFVGTEHGEQPNFVCPECGKCFDDGSATQLDDALQCPATGAPQRTGAGVMGGCRIEEEIGRGGMGIVYRARQLSLDRPVALKVLPRSLSRSHGFVQRFHEESKAMAELDHDNIVAVIDRGNEGDIYYFVMDYVEGRGLDKLIGSGIGTRQLIAITKQVCSALAYAHRRGLVHRDIKPGNIIVSDEGKVKIADFGLAGLVGSRRAPRGHRGSRSLVMGTPLYMSPEQKEDPLKVDGRSDVYSLGMVMYEMIAATRPKLKHLVPPSYGHEEADFRLDPIVMKCLRAKPSERYQSAEELMADIERFEQQLARAPGCPHCGAPNPVRFRQCERCGESLEELFDRCPQCGCESRMDVHICPNCRMDLGRYRQEVRGRLDELYQKASALREKRCYGEAIELLEQILAAEGKALQDSRAQAEKAIGITRTQRLQAAQGTFKEGQRLFSKQQFEEAIALWETIEPEALDVSETLEYAREKLEQLGAVKKSPHKFNIVLLVTAIIMMIALLLLALLVEEKRKAKTSSTDTKNVQTQTR